MHRAAGGACATPQLPARGRGFVPRFVLIDLPRAEADFGAAEIDSGDNTALMTKSIQNETSKKFILL